MQQHATGDSMYIVYWYACEGYGHVADFNEDPFDEHSVAQFGRFLVSESVWIVPGTVRADC